MISIFRAQFLLFVVYNVLWVKHSCAQIVVDYDQELPAETSALIGGAASVLTNKIRSLRGHRIVTDIRRGGHRLVEVFDDGNGIIACNIFAQKFLIGRILRPLTTLASVVLDHVGIRRMDEYMDKCANRKQRTRGSWLRKVVKRLKLKLRGLAIFPGTKWCGAGTIAKNYEDLGRAWKTDSCCRDHDHANDNLAPRKTKHGITNTKLYTMTACADDDRFFDCLKAANTPTSIAVGTMFFDVLKTKCFHFHYPLKCTAYKRNVLIRRCRKFEIDTSRPKRWIVRGPRRFLKVRALRSGLENLDDSPISDTDEVEGPDEMEDTDEEDEVEEG